MGKPQPDPTADFLTHPDFPHYRVTPDGRVYSLRSKRFLKPQPMGVYLGLIITHADGSLVHRYVHRLVLEAVAGPCPAGMEARHLNGDRYDNKASNLAWGTKSENYEDKIAHGTSPHGDRNPMARLTWHQVREIRALKQAGIMQLRIAEQFGVSPMTVSRIIRGESWVEA